MKKAIVEYAVEKGWENDTYYTPREPVEILCKYLPDKDLVVWECASGKESGITKVLTEKGYTVIETDISRGFNFLKDTPDFKYDIIITNPPYSLKTQFLKRCYEYQKPFALLLPITALEGVERNKLYRKYGLELIVMDRRVEFGGGRCWFAVAWFCWRLLPQPLIFEKVNSRNNKNTSVSNTKKVKKMPELGKWMDV